MRRAGIVGVATVILAGLTTNCDSTSTGTKGEDPSPPRLLRVLAQPAKRSCTLCAITDLLDTGPAVACSAEEPCPVTFQVHGHAAPTCQIDPGATTGICTDPLRAGPVGIGPSSEGNAIRLVFSKPLNPALDSPSMDPMNPTQLLDGVLSIEDPTGTPIDAVAWYDPGGSPVTADPISVPFGPALEIDVRAQLAPATTYTLKLNTNLVTDRLGQIPVGLPSPYLLQFTTASDLALVQVTPDVRSSLDMADMTPAVAPDDVLQLTFNVPLADPQATNAKVTAVLKQGDTVIPTELWLDSGAPGKCTVNQNQLDIVAVSAPGVPAMLAPGAYTLTLANLVDGVAGRSTAFTATYQFFVAGQPNPTADKSSVSHFYVPGATPCQ